MVKFILFDLDGTLTESGEGIMNSAEYAFRALGREVPDRAELRTFVGPPLKESFPRYGLSDEETVEAIRQFRVYFAERGWKENRLYEGVDELCGKLCDRGCALIVATSKIEVQAIRIIEYFGLKEYFTDVVGSVDKDRSSKAEVISYILEKYKIDKDMIAAGEVVMVGDRCYDVSGAAAFGIPTIGVSYGYGTREELMEAGAAAVADTVYSLAELI